MARLLKIEISESVEYLEKTLRHARSARQKERLQKLWWLKSGQVTQHQDLAHRLGRDGSTVTRWLAKYRHGGLKGLLEEKTAPGKAWEIDGEMLEQLKRQLEQPEGCKSYGEIQTWLEQEFGKVVNYKTVYKTVRYRLNAKLKVPRPCSTQQNPLAVPSFSSFLTPYPR
jgi:transposase